MQEKKVLTGFGIAVLDRGFVYVGNVEISDDWCVITNAKNIRRWKTQRGLGQLALEGPQENTEIDAVGTVRAPMRAVISLIDSEEAKWKS
jgi:hypothetical protein